MSPDISPFRLSPARTEGGIQHRTVSIEGGKNLFDIGVTKRGSERFALTLWHTELPIGDLLAEIVESYVRLKRTYHIPGGIMRWRGLQDGNPKAEPCLILVVTKISHSRAETLTTALVVKTGEKLEDLPDNFRRGEKMPTSFEYVWVKTPYTKFQYQEHIIGGGVLAMQTNYFLPKEMTKIYSATTSEFDIPRDENGLAMGLAEVLAEPMKDLPKLRFLDS